MVNMSESFRNVSMGIILNIFFLLQEPTVTTLESKKKMNSSYAIDYQELGFKPTKSWKYENFVLKWRNVLEEIKKLHVVFHIQQRYK